MRVSVQVRAGMDRWQRSIYLDSENHDYTVFFDDMQPVAGVAAPRPPADRVTAVLFVIDLTNSKPGSYGRLWIAKPALER